MNAIELIQNFLDPIKWMNMFPTIVTKDRTIEWHILSPLVEARDYYFICYFRKLDETTWIMVNVSYDLIKEIQSGVTWIEHVQVDEKILVHPMFLPLVVVRQTYGAKRWIVTLQRMCGRYNGEVGAACLPRHDLKEVLNDLEGLENVMQIFLRMVKRFYFPTSSQFKSEDRVSMRKNEEITQQKGFIRDVLAGGNILTEVARIKTGCVPRNHITIIHPYAPEEKNMLVLQESSIDELGAFLIYAPIDSSTVHSIFNGGDAKKVSILPSCFIICPDGHHNLDTYNSENAQNGSIFTMTFQILICHADNNSISLKQQKSAMTFVHYLLSSTVLNIRATLGCSDKKL
ncbi:hypothetical protein R3W88_011660 [Solanum pinnatisectum]|uniref:HD-Zip IV C-terminal domain-containing protein n=1 Tax=Solanum pinnatisectum TaxID=50273 RepID=A0AAV9L845_9SOLN|nr:hypothetical protein R3W88_011660 [Solanum pinnatisectum]